jgi:hypothetical protein
MNIYLDTEFILTNNDIQLISIGLVKTSGEAYYAISSEFEEKKASNWVKDNVLAQLEPDLEPKNLAQIKTEIVDFIGYEMGKFWAYVNTYDWFLILQLYDGIPNLPYNFSFFCRELCQEIDRIKFPETLFPPKPQAHHALADALWAKDLHQQLIDYEILINND